MTKKTVIIFLLIISANVLFAGGQSDKFNEANKQYNNGKYQEAVSSYMEVLDEGYKSPELFYNLGNAYFKLDKIPDAILFYERAKKLSPDDEDILFNLKIANLKIVDKIHTVPKLFFMEWYENIHIMFSSCKWSVISVIFVWLLFIFLTGYFIIWNVGLRKISFFGAFFCLFIVIGSIMFSLEQKTFENADDEAIIFSPSVYVKSSPDKTSTDLFILHEGTKVKLLDELENWKKIRLSDGNVGWLPNKSIEII